MCGFSGVWVLELVVVACPCGDDGFSVAGSGAVDLDAVEFYSDADGGFGWASRARGLRHRS